MMLSFGRAIVSDRVLPHAAGRPPALIIVGARSADLRRRFAGKPWLDVFSKADLLEEEFDAADELLAAGCGPAAPAVAGSRKTPYSHSDSHGVGDTTDSPPPHPVQRERSRHRRRRLRAWRQQRCHSRERREY